MSDHEHAEPIVTSESGERPLLRILEAILFASPQPLPLDMLREQLGDAENILELISELKESYQGRGIELIETDGFYSFRTAPDIAPYLKITRRPRRKLPRAASEVLAIIAYHQPVTRADIESIRGVETSRGTLDILLELGWVRPGKRRETPGRPITWHTTVDFLSHFNLSTLDDLPGLEELKAAGLLDARPVLDSLGIEDETFDREEASEAWDESDEVIEAEEVAAE